MYTSNLLLLASSCVAPLFLSIPVVNAQDSVPIDENCGLFVRPRPTSTCGRNAYFSKPRTPIFQGQLSEYDCGIECYSRRLTCRAVQYDRATGSCVLYDRKPILMGLKKANTTTTTYISNRLCYKNIGQSFVQNSGFTMGEDGLQSWTAQDLSPRTGHTVIDQTFEAYLKPDDLSQNNNNDVHLLQTGTITLCQGRSYRIRYDTRLIQVDGAVGFSLLDATGQGFGRGNNVRQMGTEETFNTTVLDFVHVYPTAELELEFYVDFYGSYGAPILENEVAKSALVYLDNIVIEPRVSDEGEGNGDEGNGDEGNGDEGNGEDTG